MCYVWLDVKIYSLEEAGVGREEMVFWKRNEILVIIALTWELDSFGSAVVKEHFSLTMY